jgi:hypothetical protein
VIPHIAPRSTERLNDFHTFDVDRGDSCQRAGFGRAERQVTDDGPPTTNDRDAERLNA